ARHFDSWWKKARATTPDLLTFSTSLLINDDADNVLEADYPDHWPSDDRDLTLNYHFEPGSRADGVTVRIPLPVLNQVEPAGFDWQVTGLREELVTALIKSLPKSIRRSFVPAPDTARAALARLSPGSGRLTDALGRELTRLRGVPIPPDAWDWSRVPDHLKITYQVVDEKGRPVAEGKDLNALKAGLRTQVRTTIASAAASIEQAGLTSWPIDTLPRTFEQRRGGHVLTGYPALVDEGDTVALRVLDTEAAQEQAMWAGTRRLLLLSAPSPVSFVQRHLSNQSKLLLTQNPDGSVADLLEDCTRAVADAIIAAAGGPPWDEAGFAALRERFRAQLIEDVFDTVADVEKVLTVLHRVEQALRSTTSLALTASLVEAKAHIAALVPPGFVTVIGRGRLPDLLRYLRGVERRLQKLPTSPQRDRANMDAIERVDEAYRQTGVDSTDIRWMIEELRVSLFAQELGTAYPVSEKRVLKAIAAL
ncbi:MAG TPA: DUF3418 domain-containing protein, partial [Jiangellaceae bacterium]|nr:DUF3418 domain-containing protein [Jiangellaceae bacterium]